MFNKLYITEAFKYKFAIRIYNSFFKRLVLLFTMGVGGRSIHLGQKICYEIKTNSSASSAITTYIDYLLYHSLLFSNYVLVPLL